MNEAELRAIRVEHKAVPEEDLAAIKKYWTGNEKDPLIEVERQFASNDVFYLLDEVERLKAENKLLLDGYKRRLEAAITAAKGADDEQ